MVSLVRSEELDAFDAIHRALLEAWLLAFELRLLDNRGAVGRWLARVRDAWSADIPGLERNARNRGHNAPNLGRDYGVLSELAHPTRNAAENSAALVVRRRGALEDEEHILEAVRLARLALTNLLYRIIWLMLDRNHDLLPMPANEARMMNAVGFADNYPTV